MNWYRRQESNLYLSLRRTLFYPLNYDGNWRILQGQLLLPSTGRYADFSLDVRSLKASLFG